MTIEHVNIADPNIHEPKGVASAVAGQVYIANGLGSGSWGTTPVGFQNTVEITSESDFPTQDATTITLEANQLYWIAAPVTTAKRFVCQNNSVLQSSAQTTDNVLTYSGTGTMFTGVNVNFTIRTCNVDCPSGEVFDFSDSLTNTSFLFIDNITIVSAASFGTFTDMGAVIMNRSATFDTDDGISLVGSDFGIFSITLSLMNSTSATFTAVDYGTAVLQTNELSNFNSTAPAGAVWLSGLASSGNIPVGKLAMVANCELGPDITPLQGITNGDVRWNFQGNNRISDTSATAFTTMNGNGTATTIASAGTPVKVAGTFTEEVAMLFSTDATGRITYIGEKDLCVNVDIILSAQIGVGTDDASVLLAKNGTVIANSAQQQELTAGDPRTMSTIWELELSENDYLEIFVQNDDTDEDITVVDAKFRVK